MILVHEHRQFKGDSSVMDTQPILVQYQTWDSEFLSQSLIWHLRNIGNEPGPSRTPLALGFWYSTHCSCIPYEFGISENDSEDDSTSFLPGVFDGCTIC
ncbi:hypothetical protein T07_14871 [Trichinella nelsoni]|uniref:Uncharacterized protein n=1 Tax=Trichinella nelsoni TaxID=6336 RepID=A0A0V0RIW8_9BILA|nr:hypothetical protein T07_14871 [Trichinella nelsoni]